MANTMTQPDPTKVVGRRVVAILLDSLLVVLPAILLLTANFEYLEVDDLPVDAETYCDTYMDQEDGACVEIDDRVYFSNDPGLAPGGFYLLSGFLVLVVLQGFTGWTPGKLLLGIRVIGEDGKHPGFVKAVLRWFLWIADGFPYVIPGLTGFIVALSTPGHRRIGDIAARTFVVKRAAAGEPMIIEDGGQLLVGVQPTVSSVPPAWAPPPAAPGAPAGWGPAVDPNAPGWASPAPGAPAEPAPAPTPAPTPSPSTEGPQWDEARGTYIQWDPDQSAWMQWDEGFKAWTRIPGQ